MLDVERWDIIHNIREELTVMLAQAYLASTKTSDTKTMLTHIEAIKQCIFRIAADVEAFDEQCRLSPSDVADAVNR